MQICLESWYRRVHVLPQIVRALASPHLIGTPWLTGIHFHGCDLLGCIRIRLRGHFNFCGIVRASFIYCGIVRASSFIFCCGIVLASLICCGIVLASFIFCCGIVRAGSFIFCCGIVRASSFIFCCGILRAMLLCCRLGSSLLLNRISPDMTKQLHI